MNRAASIAFRLARLEKAVPKSCPACAGRPRITGVAFLYKGVLQNCHGEPLAEEDLLPCPSCGGGGLLDARKVLEGVNPARLLGVKIVQGIDPAII